MDRGSSSSSSSRVMEYKNLGASGVRVSQLAYGTWMTFGNQIGIGRAKSLLRCCRDHGVNFFDCAEVYANGRAEEILGEAIQELGWKRSDIVVSTKIFWSGRGPNANGLSRKHIIEGTEASLKRLNMDYVDVLYCHRPDTRTPIEETVRAMNYLIDNGNAYYWGTSEWSAQQITDAWGVAKRLDLIGPIVEQPDYNLFRRHKVEMNSFLSMTNLAWVLPLPVLLLLEFFLENTMKGLFLLIADSLCKRTRILPMKL